ncbi:hypothetical protein [Arthrobacter sp. NicSoilB11]|uniref:hypothetical protein n=1 Tax=Arthrobacter sp. NicSoilB11 TaxID=2830999 RepID=UPI001E74494C|nr:hypothetical protein NicSoilB11_00870 [Arthrobacter sp. NicSoilB11]
MNTIRRAIEVLFVLTLAALLGGGILFVLGQAIGLVAGQAQWLTLLNDAIKTPICTLHPSAPLPGSCSATSAASPRSSTRRPVHGECR